MFQHLTDWLIDGVIRKCAPLKLSPNDKHKLTGMCVFLHFENWQFTFRTWYLCVGLLGTMLFNEVIIKPFISEKSQSTCLYAFTSYVFYLLTLTFTFTFTLDDVPLRTCYTWSMRNATRPTVYFILSWWVYALVWLCIESNVVMSKSKYFYCQHNFAIQIMEMPKKCTYQKSN